MTSEQDAHPEPVIIASFGSVGEAEVAQAKFRAYGVESAIVDNDGGGVIPVDGDGRSRSRCGPRTPSAAEILDETGSDRLPHRETSSDRAAGRGGTVGR